MRAVVSTPPQHAKTETAKHFLVWLLKQAPHKRNVYVTYESDRAEAVSLETQWIAESAGLKFEGNRKRWFTPQGGGLLATGIGGPLTGYGADGTVLIDDPFKNRAEAESAIIRERHLAWFTSTAMTRVHPGASVIIVATRWHPDDLSGRQIAKGWESINLPAIDADGQALWEARRPLEWLKAQRAEIGEYDWHALYQGEPRSRGDSVFRDAHYFTEQPTRFRISIGVDFAYSSKTYADYSVIVVLAHDAVTKTTWVLEVYRKQVEAPEFLVALRDVLTRHRGTIHAFIGGTEKGIVDFAKRGGVHINAVPASADKFTRCQPVAAAWNGGRVLLPKAAPWLDAFLAELTTFTGVRDRHDDQVDALAGAFIPIASPIAVPRRTINIPGLS